MATASKLNEWSGISKSLEGLEILTSPHQTPLEAPFFPADHEAQSLRGIWDFSTPDLVLVDKKMLISDFSGDEDMLVGYLERAGSYLMGNLEAGIEGLMTGNFPHGIQALVRMRGIAVSLRAGPLTDAIGQAIGFFEAKNPAECFAFMETLRVKIGETNCELLKIRSSLD
jgi:hypothetical protein